MSPGLQPGQTLVHYFWNYSEADHIYRGTSRLRAAERAAAVRNVQNEHTVGLELGVYERLSLVLELPFLYNRRAINGGPPSGGRVEGRVDQQSAGLGDLRILGRYWVLPAGTIPGNIALEAGVKAPTGDDSSEGTHNGERFHHDVSIQTGTGSWDPIVGAAMFLRFGPVSPFAGARYRMTPKERTGTPAFHPELADPNTSLTNSIPDQFTWRAGAYLDAGALARKAIREEELPILDRFRLSVALVGTHVLTRDLIGGSGGFRRAADAIFVEPGFEWGITDSFFITSSVPVTIYRDLKEEPGTFPEVQFNVGFSFLIR